MEEELERDNNQEEEEENYENEQEEPYENYDENNELRMEEGSHLDPPQDDMGVQEDEERNEEQMGKTDLVTQSEVFPRKRMIIQTEVRSLDANLFRQNLELLETEEQNQERDDQNEFLETNSERTSTNEFRSRLSNHSIPMFEEEDNDKNFIEKHNYLASADGLPRTLSNRYVLGDEEENVPIFMDDVPESDQKQKNFASIAASQDPNFFQVHGFKDTATGQEINPFLAEPEDQNQNNDKIFINNMSVKKSGINFDFDEQPRPKTATRLSTANGKKNFFDTSNVNSSQILDNEPTTTTTVKKRPSVSASTTEILMIEEQKTLKFHEFAVPPAPIPSKAEQNQPIQQTQLPQVQKTIKNIRYSSGDPSGSFAETKNKTQTTETTKTATQIPKQQNPNEQITTLRNFQQLDQDQLAESKILKESRQIQQQDRYQMTSNAKTRYKNSSMSPKFSSFVNDEPLDALEEEEGLDDDENFEIKLEKPRFAKNQNRYHTKYLKANTDSVIQPDMEQNLANMTTMGTTTQMKPNESIRASNIPLFSKNVFDSISLLNPTPSNDQTDQTATMDVESKKKLKESIALFNQKKQEYKKNQQHLRYIQQSMQEDAIDDSMLLTEREKLKIENHNLKMQLLEQKRLIEQEKNVLKERLLKEKQILQEEAIRDFIKKTESSKGEASQQKQAILDELNRKNQQTPQNPQLQASETSTKSIKMENGVITVQASKFATPAGDEEEKKRKEKEEKMKKRFEKKVNTTTTTTTPHTDSAIASTLPVPATEVINKAPAKTVLKKRLPFTNSKPGLRTNGGILQNAIKHVLLAGKVNEVEKAKVLQVLKWCEEYHQQNFGTATESASSGSSVVNSNGSNAPQSSTAGPAGDQGVIDVNSEEMMKLKQKVMQKMEKYYTPLAVSGKASSSPLLHYVVMIQDEKSTIFEGMYVLMPQLEASNSTNTAGTLGAPPSASEQPPNAGCFLVYAKNPLRTPELVAEGDVKVYCRYDSAGKVFHKIPTTHFGVTCDAMAVWSAKKAPKKVLKKK